MSPPNHMFLSDRGVLGLGVVAGESLCFSMEGPVVEVSLPAALASSTASSLLFFNACNKSTRSLHCSSMLRSESCKALSVSVRGT